jgi:AcrR family transcriptional regulator
MFGASGYHAASIRAIAAEAGVDPALVMHYFGTKEDLFAASIRLPLRPAEAAEAILADGIEEAGRNLARLFFGVWEDPGSRDALLAMLRGAFDTEEGARALREFITSALLERVADRLEGDDPHLRTTLAASHLIGVAVLRYVVGFEPLRDAPVDRLVGEVAPRIQTYLDG